MSERATAASPVVALVMTEQQLQDLIRREVERQVAELAPTEDGWLDTRAAAAYAGTTPNALHRITAARALRFEQDCPGGKCWFKRSWIDAWREGVAATW